MLRQHITKEDAVLFRMARYVLEQPGAAELERGSASQNNPRITAAVREKYENVAARLSSEAVAATL
jgi:hemerythrin-like domain-containing protein